MCTCEVGRGTHCCALVKLHLRATVDNVLHRGIPRDEYMQQAQEDSPFVQDPRVAPVR